MKALIVEDDFTNRTILQKWLQQWDEVHIAVNGQEAIEAIIRAREEGAAYDVIFLDIMMPELDGQAVLQRLRDHEKRSGIGPGQGSKVFMTTALSDMKNIFAAFKSLADGYLVKPLDKEKFLTTCAEQGIVITR